MPTEHTRFPSPFGDLRRPVLQRHTSITQTIRRGTADWFGVSKESDATQKWQRKSLRHCSLRYGKLKPQVIREMDLPSQDNISLASAETPPPLYVPPCQLGMQRIIDPLRGEGPSGWLRGQRWAAACPTRRPRQGPCRSAPSPAPGQASTGGRGGGKGSQWPR
uniref:inactive rhomboid protein 1-like n=1 Tax=Podarcis muralis TaxID=64176 RepID=UPI00109F0AB2|nr:inactive rhomboid protein 1-like [Podarcis muralis]